MQTAAISLTISHSHWVKEHLPHRRGLRAQLGQRPGTRLEELKGSYGLLRQICDTSLLLGGTNGPEDVQYKEALALLVALTFPNLGLTVPRQETTQQPGPAGFRKARDLRPSMRGSPASHPSLRGSSPAQLLGRAPSAPLARLLGGGSAGSTMTHSEPWVWQGLHDRWCGPGPQAGA